MRSIEKYRKQRSNYLPISIKLGVKIALIVCGYTVWGTTFLWALAAIYLFLPILRACLAFFVGVAAIILFILIMCFLFL